MNPRQSFRSPRNMRGETTSRHQQEDTNRKTPTGRHQRDEADEADAQTTPGLQLKKFNHSYQLHHRDTLVDVPLRSAGTFFILAPVRCSAEKEELTSSFISRNACHGNNTRHVPHWPGPSRRSLYSCPLSFGDGHEAAIPCPYRGFRSENSNGPWMRPLRPTKARTPPTTCYMPQRGYRADSQRPSAETKKKKKKKSGSHPRIT
jgi:hypothetical protein